VKTLHYAAGLILIALLTSACSTVPKAESMQVDDYTAATTHPETLGLSVEGGWSMPAQISKLEFAKAVETSLVSSKVFSRLVQIEAAVYRLDVVLDDVRQPPGGFNMTTEMTVLWSLSRVDTKETVWQELVQSSYTATVGQAFAGVVRARMSAEGAARNNIRNALEKLALAEL
jgi:hypothetical protein